LWTVKRLLNKHGGAIKIHSMTGEGTRVDLWWPRSAALLSEEVLATA